MSNWWEVPYPTGTLVTVKGFPRPLYPPDAPSPSKDGPDVIAMKRTVSRAGRWHWQTFDDTYSNGFAHGIGGNVGETGVAGVQRQSGIVDTGYMGVSTFDLLRAVRIPTELPNGGQPAMDKVSVSLINDAYIMFNSPPVQKTVRQIALECAIRWIGYEEEGRNLTVFGEWYGLNGQPWCAMFNTYQYEVGAASVHKDSPSFVRGSKYAYVPYIVADARAGRNGLSVTNSPLPGDLVCYDWGRDGLFDHTGLFEAGTAFSWTAIEGNTSLANQSNGGAVMRRSRKANDANVVFVRVKEPV